MVDIMMTIAAAMVISRAFSLCPSVLSMIVASLHGMLNLVHQLLPLPTAVAKRKGDKTSRLLQLIYVTLAQKATLGLQQLLLWLQVCSSSIIPCCDTGLSPCASATYMWYSQVEGWMGEGYSLYNVQYTGICCRVGKAITYSFIYNIEKFMDWEKKLERI